MRRCVVTHSGVCQARQRSLTPTATHPHTRRSPWWYLHGGDNDDDDDDTHLPTACLSVRPSVWNCSGEARWEPPSGVTIATTGVPAENRNAGCWLTESKTGRCVDRFACEGRQVAARKKLSLYIREADLAGKESQLETFSTRASEQGILPRHSGVYSRR